LALLLLTRLLPMRSLILTLAFASAALCQNFDTSRNSALKGDYFLREVLINGQNIDGTITTASSAIGVATFDGAGNYKFAGTGGATSGTYGIGANGLLYIQSLLDSTQQAFGTLAGVGPSAFIASATEGGTADMMVAIPAGAAVTVASLKGNYVAGYVSFPGADVTRVRQAAFNLTADGAGGLTNVSVSGTAQDLGGTNVLQAITGATYTLTGEGSGTLNLGAASGTQVLSGSFTLYLSADGNIFLAGTPGGDDFIIGTRAFNGSASNGSWSGVYFTGGLEDSVNGTAHAIDAFYGSWNSNGAGVSVAHDRFNDLNPSQVFDYTFSSQTPVQQNATSSPTDLPYQFTLGAGGSVFIATGNQGLYSLFVGFAQPVYSGTGVYVNPLGIVNAASFAPMTNPIAPNEILAIFGNGLAGNTFQAQSLPLPTTLGNVQVKINGTACPIFYVTPTQIAVLVPQSITPQNNIFNATVQVFNNGTPSNPVTMYTSYTSPGVFATGNNGVGPAAAQLTDYSLLTAANPAKVGSTIFLYASGLGQVNPAVPDGAAAPSNPPATATDSDQVFIAGNEAIIVFNGLTPGLAALYQLNTTIAPGTPTGTGFADVSTPDAYTSQTTITVAGGSAKARTSGLHEHARTHKGRALPSRTQVK
jgi:uncharacterized protein (TIGR03437 family)